MRPTTAEINLGAIARNVGLLVNHIKPATLCAVVKANGYGHGLVESARTAADAGATMLAVALVEEGHQLRQAGIQTPILLLSEPPLCHFLDVVANDLTPTVYQASAIAAANDAAVAAKTRLPVHLKIDTGMARVGAPPHQALNLANNIAQHKALQLAGVWSHCAVADDLTNPFTAQQIQSYQDVVAQLESAGHHGFVKHIGNSAVALAHSAGHLDMVRSGIALYGIAPSVAMQDNLALQAAMTIRTEVAMVKNVAAGTPVSYGHHYVTPARTQLATIPIGYADGLPRRLGTCGGEVLIGGLRRPIAGVVTMDQTVVDCGLAQPVQASDEVILLGKQGTETITATEIAARLGTIAYEIVCRLSQRVPLRFK